MFIKLDGSGTLAQQIYHALRRAILAGQLAPGVRLPATRPLAHELGVSRNTVLLAYDQLAALFHPVLDGKAETIDLKLADKQLKGVPAEEKTYVQYFVGQFLMQHGKPQDGERYLEAAAETGNTRAVTTYMAAYRLRARAAPPK